MKKIKAPVAKNRVVMSSPSSNECFVRKNLLSKLQGKYRKQINS